MEYIKTDIEGVWVIEPKVFNDQRGYFFEAFKQAEFDEHIGYHVDFIQDMSLNLALACYEDCITRRVRTHKLNW